MNKDRVEIINMAIDCEIKDMSYPSLQFLWSCFVNKEFSHFIKVRDFLDFLQSAVRLVPTEECLEIVKHTFDTIDEKLYNDTREDLKNRGINPDELVKIAKKSKKEEKPKKEETKIIKVNNDEEFRKALDEIIKEMKESMRNAD